MLLLPKGAFKEVSNRKGQIGGPLATWLGVFQELFWGNGNLVNLPLSDFQAYDLGSLILSAYPE